MYIFVREIASLPSVARKRHPRGAEPLGCLVIKTALTKIILKYFNDN